MVGQVFIGSRVGRMVQSDGGASGNDGFLLAVELGRRVLPSARCCGRRPCALAAAGLGNDATFPSSGPVPVPLLRRENVRGRCRGGAGNSSHFANRKWEGCGGGKAGTAKKQWVCRCLLHATMAKSNPRAFLIFFDLWALKTSGCKPCNQ